jgi:hypothetical protein
VNEVNLFNELISERVDMTESQMIETVNRMAVESLSPDNFEKWSCVYSALTTTRNCHKDTKDHMAEVERLTAENKQLKADVSGLQAACDSLSYMPEIME